MVTVGGSYTDLESIDSNDNRLASNGADQAVDPADAGSVVGGGGGGARLMSDGGRSIFNNSRPVIVGKRITNRTWTRRRKMTNLSFSERAVWETVVTVNRGKHYAFIRRCGKMMKI